MNKTAEQSHCETQHECKLIREENIKMDLDVSENHEMLEVDRAERGQAASLLTSRDDFLVNIKTVA